MKRLFIVLLMMVMVGSLFGVKVILHNGNTYTGFVHAKTDNKIVIFDNSLNDFVNIRIADIDKILSDDDSDITVNSLAMGNFDNRNISTDYKTKTELNMGMLAIGASLVILAWDSFAEAGDISDTIKDYEDLELKTSKLEKTRSRKNAIGAVLAVSSIITFVYSFEQVEVQAAPTSLSLSYKF